MYDFDTIVNRKNTGNMKGNEFAHLGDGEAVNLFGAEMDYPTAPFIRKALSDFALNGIYGFTVPTDEYLSSVCGWMKNARGADVEPDWILGTLGTVYAMCTAVRAFTGLGDGVIIQSPSYFRHDSAVRRNGRRIVYDPLIEREGVYELDIEGLEQKMAHPSNKLMILVNPHNPTGKVFSEKDLMHIAELAAKHGVIVFSDEIFAETAQPGFEFRPYSSFDPRSITCFGLGKAFNFTGVSQANVMIPDKELREAYEKQRDTDHYGSIDPFFYNAVLAAYSEQGRAWLKEMNANTAANHHMISERFRTSMPKLGISPLEGTFVAWTDMRRLGLEPAELKNFLEKEAHIYADPGDEYGAEGRGFYRWNIGSPRRMIDKALDKLEEAYCRRGF